MFTKVFGCLIALFICGSVLAAPPQFKHFKLTDKFQTYHGRQDLPPVLQDLWKKIKDEGYKVINSAIKEIFDQRQNVNLGELNFPEAGWQAKLEGNIQIGAVRKLEPMLNQDGWIVVDRLILGIGARQYLQNLRDEGQIEISDRELNMFAGIFYKREYSYQHFAKTYEDGLKQNLDKLFKSFQKFKNTDFLSIDNSELIQKDEFMSLRIGASAKSPSVYTLRLKGGTTVTFSKLSSISYHRTDQNRDNEDQVRVSHKKMRVKGGRAEVELQLDFLNLLKISLLGGEYSYNVTKTKVAHYTFAHNDLASVPSDAPLYRDFQKFNKGKNPRDLTSFEPYKDGYENSRVATENSALFLLMWGKLWGNSTEELVLRLRGYERFFYRYQQERVAFDRNLLDTIFRSGDFSKYKTRQVENLVFEFEAPEKQRDINSLPGDVVFSLRLSKEFSAKKAKRSDREKVKKMIQSFQNVDGGIVTGIDEGKIKAPFSLDLNAQISVAGIENMFQHSQFELNRIYGLICSGDWIADMAKVTKTVKRCMNKFDNTYRALYVEYHYNKTFALGQFKSFMEHLGQNAKNFVGLKYLFGLDHVQLYGRFNGKTETQLGFQTYFKEGQFQGHGVIKDALLKL